MEFGSRNPGMFNIARNRNLGGSKRRMMTHTVFDDERDVLDVLKKSNVRPGDKIKYSGPAQGDDWTDYVIMKDGKKFKAEKILKNVLVKISLKGYSPVKVLTLAVNNVKPLVEVRNVRLKGKSFQVPFPIQISRQISSSLKIILSSSKNKKNFEDSLVAELIDSSLNRSSSVKTTLALHKLASQNRLFTYYRWF